MWTTIQCNNPSLTILGIPSICCPILFGWTLKVSNYSLPKLRAGSPENGTTNGIFEIPNLETNHFLMKHVSSGPIHHLPSCDTFTSLDENGMWTRMETCPLASASWIAQSKAFRGSFLDGTLFEWLRPLYIYIYILYIWVFPKIGVPQNGWIIMQNPIKMDDLGGKPTIFGNIHIFVISLSHHPYFCSASRRFVFGGWMDVWNERFVSVN